MLKEKYERSEMEIILFRTEDVISTSGLFNEYEGWNPKDYGGSDDEYEGWMTR